jgi:CDP-diacylglycerol---serine O-phosphatidyltransferase
VNRARAYQWAANAATLTNASLGVGAIAYTLAGNKLIGLLMVVGAIAFDGLDGMLHRRGGGPPNTLGRYLDSGADAISFGLAPGVFVAYHSYGQAAYAPYALAALLVGALVAVLAVTRLVYFTLRHYSHPHFIGASTPQTTLAIVTLVLFADQPGYFGHQPLLLLVGAALLAPLMVLPIPYPKIRRGERLRRLMTLTSVALAVALIPVQFRPAPGSPAYLVSEVGAIIAAIGIMAYYFLGPRSARGGAPVVPGGPTYS